MSGSITDGSSSFMATTQWSQRKTCLDDCSGLPFEEHADEARSAWLISFNFAKSRFDANGQVPYKELRLDGRITRTKRHPCRQMISHLCRFGRSQHVEGPDFASACVESMIKSLSTLGTRFECTPQVLRH